MEDQNAIPPRDFGRLEGKIDAVLEELKKNGTNHAALEARVRKVEAKQYWIAGAAAGAAFIFAKVDFTKIIAVAHAAGSLG